MSFEGIKIVSAQVNAKQPNVVTTFFKDDLLDLSHGINFGTGHKIQVSYYLLINIEIDENKLLNPVLNLSS